MDDEKFDLNSRIWVWFNSVLSYDNIIAHDFLNEIDGCATFADVSEKAAKGVDDAVQAVKAYRLEGKRVHREVIPGYLYETAKAAAAKTAGGADGGTGPHI